MIGANENFPTLVTNYVQAVPFYSGTSLCNDCVASRCAGPEGFRRIILPNRSALSTRMRAIKAALATGCIMFVFEAAKQALYPKTSIWTSHTITILFTALAAAVVIFEHGAFLLPWPEHSQEKQYALSALASAAI